MPSEVILPRVDMDMATGKIAKWLVEPGTRVAKGQPLFEIETDKATMEIEAEAAGTIRDLVAAGATDIPVGSVVAWIDATGEARAEPARRDLARPAMRPEPSKAFRADERPTAAPGEGRFRATPLARRLARHAALDLRGLQGSGPRGRIQAADVAAKLTVARPSAVQGGVDSALDTVAPPPDRPAAPARAVASGEVAGLRRLREGSGAPLLLVHGFGADANGWRSFLQGPSLDRPVLGLDLPGHGEAASRSAVSFDDVVDDVEQRLAGETAPVDVVAHSLGAAVMTAVAARGAVPVRSLLLLAPAGLGPDINGSFVQGFLDARSEGSLMPWMRLLVADPDHVTPSLVRATLRVRETSQVDAQRRLAATLFPDGVQAFGIRAELARLRVPTRVVFGTADAIIPARHAQALPPLVALHRLPGIGHMPQLEARDTVAAIMRQMSMA